MKGRRLKIKTLIKVIVSKKHLQEIPSTSLLEVPTKVDLHFYDVTCGELRELRISHLENTEVIAVTNFVPVGLRACGSPPAFHK